MCTETEDPRTPAGYSELRAAQGRKERLDRQYDACNEMPARPMTDEEIIAKIFTYVPPTERTIPKFTAVRQAGKHFAEVVIANCPPGPDRATVINCIRNAVMFANASISLNGQAFF